MVQGEGLNLRYMNSHLPMYSRALDTHDYPEVCGEPGHIVPAPAVTAGLVGRDGPDIVDEGSLELHKALVLPRPSVVLEGSVQGLLLGVEEDGHPFFTIRIRLSLEMICSKNNIYFYFFPLGDLV